MESLLVTGKGSHVAEVENYLSCIICNDYLADKIEILNDYLIAWNKEFYQKTLSKIKSEFTSPKIKLAELLCFKENEDILKEIGEELSGHSTSPLLLNKLWEASQLFKSIKKIKELRKKVKDSIKFSVKRIYLMRNEIVHQGAINNATENLVEMAHHYLDNILNKIVNKSYDHRMNISDFLYEQKMVNDEYDRFLNLLDDSLEINSTNFKRILFSPDYHLHVS